MTTYAETTDRIAEATGLSKKDVDRVLDELRSTIHSELKAGGDVYLPEIGRFETQDRKARKARKGRHPQTGEPIDIPAQPAKRVPNFVPAAALKRVVAE